VWEKQVITAERAGAIFPYVFWTQTLIHKLSAAHLSQVQKTRAIPGVTPLRRITKYSCAVSKPLVENLRKVRANLEATAANTRPDHRNTVSRITGSFLPQNVETISDDVSKQSTPTSMKRSNSPLNGIDQNDRNAICRLHRHGNLWLCQSDPIPLWRHSREIKSRICEHYVGVGLLKQYQSQVAFEYGPYEPMPVLKYLLSGLIIVQTIAELSEISTSP
jgi:hypothetical protein